MRLAAGPLLPTRALWHRVSGSTLADGYHDDHRGTLIRYNPDKGYGFIPRDEIESLMMPATRKHDIEERRW
jgi:hypothetical protein